MDYAAGLRRLLSLPVSVDAVSCEPLRRGDRETTVVRAAGEGIDGLGEDVTHDRRDRSAFRWIDLGAVVVSGALGAVLERLDTVDLASRATHAVVARYRRWAVESALIDLALRQSRVALSVVLGIEPRPVRFVVSPGARDPRTVLAFHKRAPSVRLKLDPRSGWQRREIQEIAGLGKVDVLDLKGTYPGTSVYQPADPRLY